MYPENIIRAKGVFWLASEPDKAINFSQAGGSTRIESAGVWWASMPFKERMTYVAFVENKSFIESKWHKKWGDRKNELVLIGQNMDEEKIRQGLLECLCTEAEYDTYHQNNIPDPFEAII